MENTVSRELRNIRICLIILIIVIAFWDREKTVEITDHDSDSSLNISNMTQVSDNTFAYKDESNKIKIFKFNPDTNEIKLIKEFYTNEYEWNTWDKRHLKVSFLFSKGPAHVYTSKHKVNGIR